MDTRKTPPTRGNSIKTGTRPPAPVQTPTVIRGAQKSTAGAAGRGASTSIADTIAEAAAATVTQTLDTAQQMDETSAAVRDAATSATDQAARSVGATQQALADTAGAMQSNGEHAARDAGAEMTQITTDRVDALLDSIGAVTRGMEEMRRAWMELMRHSFDQATRGPQELMRCTSMHEIADVQRGLLRDGVDTLVNSSRTMLDISTRTARDTARPLAQAVLPGRMGGEREGQRDAA